MLSLLTRKRVAWVGAIVLIVSALCAAAVLIPWSIGPCGEDDGMESHSPDGKYVAKVFVRSCGATTGWLTHVNLRSRWDYFNTKWTGGVFQGQVFSVDCWTNVNLVWKDNSHLEIQHDVCPRCDNGDDPAFVKQNSWRGIDISYRELPCNLPRR